MKCLVVDDHPLTRDGTTLALQAVAADVQVLEAASLAAARERLQASDSPPDLILLDLDLEDSKGLATLEALQGWLNEHDMVCRIVVLSGHDDPALVRTVIDTCATGFIVKASARELFQHAIALTLAGGVYIPPLALRAMAQAPSPPGVAERELVFTPREAEIAALLIKGYTYKRLAQELARKHGGAVISDQTVRAHVGNIAWKLGVTENVKSGVMAEIARRGLTFDD